MLKIRLARVGKKKRPAYRFIVSEAAKDPYGRALEILGHYNPFSKVIEVNKERILYWISKGAQVSPTAYNLLVDQKVIEGEKVKASKGKVKNKKGEESTDSKTTADSGGKKDGVLADKVAEKVEEKKDEKTKEETKIEKPAGEPKVEEKPDEKPEEAEKQDKTEEKPADKPKEEAKPEEKKEEPKEEKKDESK